MRAIADVIAGGVQRMLSMLEHVRSSLLAQKDNDAPRPRTTATRLTEFSAPGKID